MDANTARNLHLRRLVAEAGGPAEWTRRYGGERWGAAQVSQWISEDKPKGVGKKLARALEAAMGLAIGSLDKWDEDLAPSQSAGLDHAKLQASIDFLADLFSAKGRAFNPRDHTLMIAAVYSELTATAKPNVVEMGIRYGRKLDGDDDERQGQAGSVGKDDFGRTGKGSRKAKVATGGSR